MEGNISLSEARVRYCLYARKSTESDEQQALSIDSQIKEMQTIAERHNLNVVDVKRESHSAKESGQRPVFRELLADIASEKYNGILTMVYMVMSRQRFAQDDLRDEFKATDSMVTLSFLVFLGALIFVFVGISSFST